MNNQTHALEKFFDRYSNLFNQALNEQLPDLKQVADLYANCFLAANPSGISCGNNDKVFEEAMTKGYAFYRGIGIKNMEIVSRDITLLDSYHAMARIRWRCDFVKKDAGKGSVEFDNIYFVRTSDNRHSVFAWITGDEQAVLKEIGLIS